MTNENPIPCPRCGEDLTPQCWDNHECTHCGQNLVAIIDQIYALATALSEAKAAMETAILRTLTKRKTKGRTWDERVIAYLGGEVGRIKTVLKQFGDSLDDGRQP